jgi:CheY-like chemotaxis protein
MKDLLIAVVDDDPAYLTLIQEALAYEGEQTLLCDGHDDAAAVIRREQPDVVILDLWMGGGAEGWAVLDRLRSDPNTADIPVILCSGDVDALREKACVLWQRECITLAKPFSVDDLMAKIDQAAFPRPTSPLGNRA